MEHQDALNLCSYTTFDNISRFKDRKSKLSMYDLKYIKETVKAKGYRKGAQELGVDKSTLFRYLKAKNK
jgi:hypothetical protein